jgi:hypothetical protein
MGRVPGKQGFEGTEFHSIMALRPEIEGPWYALNEAMKFQGLLDSNFKEEVRKVIATRGGCAYCASLGAPGEEHADPKLQAAVDFANRVCDDPTQIDDATWSEVSKHFNFAELVELSVWISFMYGSNMFGAIMKVSPATKEGVQQYCDLLEVRSRKEKRPPLVQTR